MAQASSLGSLGQPAQANCRPASRNKRTGIVGLVPGVGARSRRGSADCRRHTVPAGRDLPSGRLPVKSPIPSSSRVGIAITRSVANVAGFGKDSGSNGVVTPGLALRSVGRLDDDAQRRIQCVGELESDHRIDQVASETGKCTSHSYDSSPCPRTDPGKWPCSGQRWGTERAGRKTPSPASQTGDGLASGLTGALAMPSYCRAMSQVVTSLSGLSSWSVWDFRTLQRRGWGLSATPHRAEGSRRLVGPGFRTSTKKVGAVVGRGGLCVVGLLVQRDHRRALRVAPDCVRAVRVQRTETFKVVHPQGDRLGRKAGKRCSRGGVTGQRVADQRTRMIGLGVGAPTARS